MSNIWHFLWIRWVKMHKSNIAYYVQALKTSFVLAGEIICWINRVQSGLVKLKRVTGIEDTRAAVERTIKKGQKTLAVFWPYIYLWKTNPLGWVYIITQSKCQPLKTAFLNELRYGPPRFITIGEINPQIKGLYLHSRFGTPVISERSRSR